MNKLYTPLPFPNPCNTKTYSEMAKMATLKKNFFAISVDDVVAALGNRLVGAPNGDKWRVRCPNGWQHKNDDNHPSAWLNMVTGWVNCAVCGAIEPQRVVQLMAARRQGIVGLTERPTKAPPGHNLQDLYDRLPTAAGSEIARQRCISDEACAVYGLRIGDGDCIPKGALVLPYVDEHGSIVGLKYRLPEGYGQRYGAVRGSSFSVVFGLQAIDIEYRNPLLCVVEGEINAISLWQAVGQFADVVSIGSQQPTAAQLDALQRLAIEYKCVVVWTDEPKAAKALLQALNCIHTVAMRSLHDGGVKYDANASLVRYGAYALASSVAERVRQWLPELSPEAVRLFVRGQQELVNTSPKVTGGDLESETT